MPLIRPFAGLRPAPESAADVVAPPYDVLNTAEARERAAGRPYSFLHISKPEIDLPEGTDPYAPEVYAKAAENLAALREAGVLIQDEAPCYYVYRLRMGEHEQTGLVGAASVAAYDSNRIRKHEFTRPQKEDDRVRQIEACGAQTGPVLLAYQADAGIDGLLAKAAGAAPDYDVTADDGVRHTLWVVRDAAVIEELTRRFDALPAIYIADGHHRSAAASRVAAARGGDPEAAHQYFLSVIFPHDQMRIYDYNRVVTDLNGLSAEQLLARVTAAFTARPEDAAVRPARAAEFGMYLGNGAGGGQWYRLAIRPELIPEDPVKSLDVSLLADHLLAPVLGIEDPRRDPRIDFVGGIRGLGELERRVNSGEMAVAFSMYPTPMPALMAVAEAGEVMPPKSTWFEPKLADGLVSHLID